MDDKLNYLLFTAEYWINMTMANYNQACSRKALELARAELVRAIEDYLNSEPL